MSQSAIRDRMFSYVSPAVTLFPAAYGLVFGTRHGVRQFGGDIQKLYEWGYFKQLIISGGITDGDDCSEAAVMSRELVARGVPKTIMILEDHARNTCENVVFSRSKIGNASLTDILLVGKMSSARRYIMTVRKQWPEIRHICCHRVNYSGCDEKRWWEDAEFRKRIISECRKIPAYLAKGYIQEIEIVNGVVI